MDETEAAAWVQARLGWTGAACRLPGRRINEVFRVRDAANRRRSVIVKHAPVVGSPASPFPLDPSRARIEVAALLAAQGRPSRRIASPVLRAASGSTLAMEDLGEAPDLVTWLREGGDRRILTDLGIGLRGMHQRGDAPALVNRPAQQVHLDRVVRPVGRLLADAGIVDAHALGERARALGERLCRPGPCWVHGDLRPGSVRVVRGRPALIDWQRSTRGQRCQDLGQVLAHLWMWVERRDLDPTACHRLYAAYGVLSEQDMEDTAITMGCEILAHSVGPCRPGSLYDGLSREDPAVRHAVRVAAELIRSGIVLI